MSLLRATFDRELACEKVNELLALEDKPERLAEKLNVPRDVEKIRAGLAKISFKKLVSEVEKLREFVELEKEIADVEAGKFTLSFLGKGYAVKKLEGLMERRRKFGSLIETPRWFFSQERVWLLNSVRDYALDSSHQGDAEWAQEELESLPLPVSAMFEAGNVETAKAMAAQLGLPFHDTDPQFVLTQLEGHRALYLDMEKQAAFYFMPIKGM
jgi:hypothetical protein